MSVVERETSETRVRLEITRGTGRADVSTGARFLDHMMVTLARYSRLDLSLQATGDLKHHLIEDVGIAFGVAIADITPPTCARYGHRVVPMDDAVVEVAVDLGGRPYYRGPIPSSLYDHWLRSFTDHARATVHVRVLRGQDRHHVVEAAFKALGMSLHDALIDSGVVFSTKGAVQW
jgi:imidazoleglycerol-phosphate dehydratase